MFRSVVSTGLRRPRASDERRLMVSALFSPAESGHGILINFHTRRRLANFVAANKARSLEAASSTQGLAMFGAAALLATSTWWAMSYGNLHAPLSESTPANAGNGAAHAEEADDSAELFGVAQHAANDPIEDRATVSRLDALDATFMAVFDGHSGYQTSDFAHKYLHRILDLELSTRLGSKLESFDEVATDPLSYAITARKNRERIIAGALAAAFERADRVFMQKVGGAFEVGFGRDTRAGSCALVALLVEGTLFVANAGDSRAVLAVNSAAYGKLPASERETPYPQYGLLTESREEHASTPDQARSTLVGASAPTTTPVQPSSSNPDAADPAADPAAAPNQAQPVVFQATEFLRRAAEAKGVVEETEGEQADTLRNTLIRDVRATQTESSAPIVVPPPTNGAASGSNGGNGDATAGEAHKPLASKPSKPTKETFLALDMTLDHNCREPRERRKLEREHPDEVDVVICKRSDACYVKGKLQPTRALGDYYLKYAEFMRGPDENPAAGRFVSPPYTPPYITATPEVTISKLRPGVDDFLVMGTDGLWDFVTSQEAVEIAASALRGPNGNPAAAAEALKRRVVTVAAERAGLTPEQLLKLPPGRDRRRKHDDVTIIVLDLRRAFEHFWWG